MFLRMFSKKKIFKVRVTIIYISWVKSYNPRYSKHFIMAPNYQVFCVIIESLYFLIIFFSIENEMFSPNFFNVKNVNSSLVEGE